MIADVASIAVTQVGVTEKPGNRGLPLERYGLPGEQPLPWCARFVRWVSTQAGRPLPGNPYEIASVARMRAELEAAGAILPTGAAPRRGDIVFLRGRGASDAGPGNHVGIVESVDGEAFVSLDGNWGDAVRRVHRRIDQADIWGFARWPVERAE